MNIPFTRLMQGQLEAALTNVRLDLRYCLADADAGIAASIYKRATDEVDFFSLTSSNISENDLEDFGYGLATRDEEGYIVTLAYDEETNENGYLRGTDRRLLPQGVPEELEHNFEPQGSEILDVSALLELEGKMSEKFDEQPQDVRQFRIRARDLRDVVSDLPFRPGFSAKDWTQRSLVHFQPQNFHNEETDEYVFLVYKPHNYDEGNWKASITYFDEAGDPVDFEYDVDLTASRRGSDELMTDDELLEYPDGVPMFGSLQTVILHNYKDEPYEEEQVVLSRPYEKGVRVAIQDLGSSGMRMPAISEKYHRTVSVVALKANKIEADCLYLLPFDGDPARGERASRNASPFTLQLDDINRVVTIFDEEDTIEVTYLHTHDPESVIPVRFETVHEFDGKDEQGRRHFLRKVAYVAAVRPAVNGKVVIQ